MKPLAILLLLTSTSFAAPGDFLGYFQGNDDAVSVSAALGIDVTLLGKVDDPPGADGTFTIDVSLWDGTDPLAGTWQWQGITPANLLTMKSNGGWAAYYLLPPCDEPLGTIYQSGTWDTSLHLEGKGLSHASVWSVDCVHAPEPSTGVLVCTALLCAIAGYMVSLVVRGLRQ